MPIPGFQAERCQQRNRVAARRGFSSTPVRFLQDGDFTGGGASPSAGRVTPLCTDAQAMARINAARPGEEPLTPDDVYLHFIEAANGNFVPDRFIFLGTSTLRNIVRDGNAGFAFMNSHRTGGLSHPAELPFGRTFIGRYEKGDPASPGSERALIGFYMLRGIHPNGEGGPSTDDMHRMIDGGTLFDVSVGLYGGVDICDVCGEDLNAYDPEEGWLCPHVPGTHHRMTAEEIAAQKDRGVPGGQASSTKEDAGCGEVSGVFDGAVPGAGFRKALSLSRSGGLDRNAAAQARAAYATLLSAGEAASLSRKGSDTFSEGENDLMDGDTGIIAAIEKGFASLGTKLGIGQPPPAPAPVPAQHTGPTPEVLAAQTTKINDQAAKMTEQAEQLARAQAEINELKTQRVSDKTALALRDNLSWIETQTKAFKINPAAAEHFTKLATENPAALEALKPAIEANAAITSLAGDPNRVDAQTLVGDKAGAAEEGTRLETLTQEHLKANPGVSYADAFATVCASHKELAAAYRAGALN